MAGAPGPSAGKPPADILFTVTGSRAVLTADTLTLTGVAPVALHTTFGQGAGATPIGAPFKCCSLTYWNLRGYWLLVPHPVMQCWWDVAWPRVLV